MSERKLGQVVPFTLSAGRMRRGAQEYRRRGHPVEAAELLRRAAEQEDTALGWLNLAEQLRHMGCWEQASKLLYRLLGREELPPMVWLELGRCLRRMGRYEAAIDSLEHYLMEDCFSDAAEEARSLLDEIEDVPEEPDPFRVPLMIRRGLTAWQEGKHSLGERRLRRAIRLSGQPARLSMTLGMLLMEDGRCAEACTALNAARRADPGNEGYTAMLCMALDRCGRRRAALGLMRQRAPFCATAEEENLFMHAAGAMRACGEEERFLRAWLRQYPCRLAYLQAMADVCWRRGEGKQALTLWRRMLRIDPENARARVMIEFAEENPDAPLPAEEEQMSLEARRMSLLARLPDNAPPDWLLTPLSDARTVTEWCFETPDAGLQQTMLMQLQQADTFLTRRYLRELLVLPTVYPSVRRQAMMILAAWGDTGPFRVLTGARVSMVECRPARNGRPRPWRAFLPRLLENTRGHGQAEAITAFAAELWPCLTPAQRMEAAGPGGFGWVKAMEILYLRTHGQEETAARVACEMSISLRKVNRAMRAIIRRINRPVGETWGMDSPGKDEHDETVH